MCASWSVATRPSPSERRSLSCTKVSPGRFRFRPFPGHWQNWFLNFIPEISIASLISQLFRLSNEIHLVEVSWSFCLHILLILTLLALGPRFRGWHNAKRPQPHVHAVLQVRQWKFVGIVW